MVSYFGVKVYKYKAFAKLYNFKRLIRGFSDIEINK